MTYSINAHKRCKGGKLSRDKFQKERAMHAVRQRQMPESILQF